MQPQTNPNGSIHPQRQAILDRVRHHGLEREAGDLDRLGYAIVADVAPPEFIRQLRAECLDALDATGSAQAAMLLRRGGIFEAAVCLPKLLAVAEYMVGKGCLLSQLSAQRKGQAGNGRADLNAGLRNDLVGIREPFGEYPWLITAVIALDDWRDGAGGMTVVPASHKLQYRPAAGVDSRELVTLSMRGGSAVIWNGGTYHGSTPRVIPGERVTLHITYSRLVLRTWEDYSDVARELERSGEGDSVLAGLLGAQDPFGKNTDQGQRSDKIRNIHEWCRT